MLRWIPKAPAKIRESYISFQVKGISCFLHPCYRRHAYPKLGIIQGTTQTLRMLTCHIHLVPQGKLEMSILCLLLGLLHSSALSIQRHKNKISFLFYLSKYQLFRLFAQEGIFYGSLWDKNRSIFYSMLYWTLPFFKLFSSMQMTVLINCLINLKSGFNSEFLICNIPVYLKSCLFLEDNK